MQTFLPYADFTQSAKSLDSKRLGKQRAEVKQLLIALYLEELRSNIFLIERVGATEKVFGSYYEGVRNHPACVQWENYPYALMAYGTAICLEWVSRGNQDTTYLSIEAFNDNNDILLDQEWMQSSRPDLLPNWLGDDRVHLSHRSRLAAKDPVYYKHWSAIGLEDYFWPGRNYIRSV